MSAIITLVNDLDPVTRCRVCEHILTAERSVKDSIGPVCRARLASTIARATGRRVVVRVLAGNLVAQLGPVAL